MKKTLSLILALLMSISCASFAAADDAAIEDADVVVEEPTPYDEAILFLQDKDIMQGKEDGLIHAGDDVKRYEMAILTARISTGWLENKLWEDDFANDSAYSDLAGTGAEKFYGAISYADQKGIIEGYPDGSFKPEQQVTYREALAMATRTLGYTGLTWPWGNIEKAVNLGLTEGIEDVAYTTPLNRGQVAQIIYNTLFAKVNGETLAMNIFGIDRAWETILVTSTDRAAYVQGGSPAKDGLVGFQIVEEDGTLDSNVYYVAEGDFELGVPYRALFNVDEEADLVELVKAIECDVIATAANVGITNNEGKAIDDAYPVNTLIDKYSLTEKYHYDNILANDSYVEAELILVDGTKMTTIETVTSNKQYGFEIATGNIVKLEYTDGKVTGSTPYWYYDETLDCYFKLSVLNDTTYVDIVDEDDVDALLGNLYVKGSAKVTGYDVLTSKPGKSAYSSVKIWDLNDKAYGIYEAYRLGKYSEGTDGKCAKCDKKDLKAYTLADLSTTSYAIDATKAAEATYSYVTEVLSAGVADGQCDCVGYVFAEGYEPSADAKYVIYGVNKTTKEIKIVKEVEKLVGDVEDLTDVDTFYATGVVNGYRMSKNTITIGETSYNWEYDTLGGTSFAYVTKNTATKALYTEYFAKIFGQFVEYVVVDGKIVHLEPIGASDSNYIVVESFAGISNDNYIVVNGYSTDALVYDQFRIAAYDGNQYGNKFWYGTDYDDDFTKGTVYQITSYDADKEAYFVTSLGNADWNNAFDTTGLKNVIIDASDKDYYEDGYVRVGTETAKLAPVKNEGFKVIIIGDPNADMLETMPFYVYSGSLGEGWHVEGKVLYNDDNTYIIVAAKDIFGFNLNAWEYSMVVILRDVITDMVYDGYDTDYAWYLQGATGKIVEAFDIFTGNMTQVCAGINLDLEVGNIYSTVLGADGKAVILEDGISGNWDDLRKHYDDVHKATATYLIDEFVASENIFAKNDLSKLISKDMLEFNYEYTGLVSADPKVYSVSFKNEWYEVASIEAFSKDDYKALVAAGLVEDSLKATVIYNVEDKTAVVYVYVDDYSVAATDKPGTTGSIDVVSNDEFLKRVDGVDVKITGTIDYTYDTLDDKISTKYDLTSMNLTFAGIDGITHANLSKYGYNFGVNTHDTNDYKTTVKIAAQGKLSNTNAIVTLGDNFDNTLICDDCGLVVGIKVDLADTTIDFDGVNRYVVDLTIENEFIEEDGSTDKFTFYARTYIERGSDGKLVLVDVAQVKDKFNGNTYDLNTNH